jgi:hypothetical protein
MSHQDIGPLETVGSQPERNLNQELAQASEIGRIVLTVARERTVAPQFRVKRYSMPLLEPEEFPFGAVGVLTEKRDLITEADVKAAKEASMVLAIEAAAQIIEAKPTSGWVIDDPNSLQQMGRMISRARGLALQLETIEPSAIIKGGKLAIEKRKGVRGLEEAENWNDQQVLAWTKEIFNNASSRLAKKIETVNSASR